MTTPTVPAGGGDVDPVREVARATLARAGVGSATDAEVDGALADLAAAGIPLDQVVGLPASELRSLAGAMGWDRRGGPRRGHAPATPARRRLRLLEMAACVVAAVFLMWVLLDQ